MNTLHHAILKRVAAGPVAALDLIEDESLGDWREVVATVNDLVRIGQVRRAESAEGWVYSLAFPGVDIDAVHRRFALETV